MQQSRHIILTEDSSHTIIIPESNITYHSKHGAIQESMHVFIQAGLDYFIKHKSNVQHKSIQIFEMGFGTGLNALLSLQYAIQHNQKITYQTTELFPLSIEEVLQLNYAGLAMEDLKESFYTMHTCEWYKPISLHACFSFQKMKTALEKFETPEQFHVVFFDAFDPNTQPQLWTESIFKKMFDMLYTNGILVTYCSKGIVQRAMKAAGFNIEKLKGPPGKREIVRVVKSN